MKSIRKNMAVGALTLCSMLFASNLVAADKPILLKMPIYYGSHLPGLGTPAKYIADNASLLSGGSLKVKLYEPKKLIASGEILDAVSTGKVQAGYATPGNWGGKMPAARLFSSRL